MCGTGPEECEAELALWGYNASEACRVYSPPIATRRHVRRAQELARIGKNWQELREKHDAQMTAVYSEQTCHGLATPPISTLPLPKHYFPGKDAAKPVPPFAKLHWVHSAVDTLRLLEHVPAGRNASWFVHDVVGGFYYRPYPSMNPARCVDRLLEAGTSNHAPLLAMTVPEARRAELAARGVHLVPNHYELAGHVENDIHHTLSELEAAGAKPFHQRRPMVFYRGMCKGWQRYRAFGWGAAPSNHKWLDANASDYSPKSTFFEHRYLLDIGGTDGATWSALRWKMATGSLVFKVDNRMMILFHTELEKDVHYVAVKEDLSDLHTVYQWAVKHPEEVGRRAYLQTAHSPPYAVRLSSAFP